MPNEWQSVLDEISNNVSEMAFNVYFTNFNLVSNEDGVITVSVPNSMIKNSIEKKFLSAVEGALEANHIKYDKINIIIQEGDKKKKAIARRAIEVLPENQTQSISSVGSIAKHDNTSNIVTYGGKTRFSTTNSGLNPKYRFDNYVIGSNNDLAVSAARAVIEHPGERYNPYFIYGGSGLGKTHLIQAIGNEIQERYPEKKVLYVTIEQFYHEFVEAMRKKIEGFAEKYRHVDVLIVDDFQYIVGKEKSQEEFFHTFNELHNANKQIIVSSDRLPNQIATVDARLASRLMTGIPIDIQMPDFEVRCAILKMKAEMIGAEIDDKTVEYLADNIRTNIRDLEGELNRILAIAEMRGVPPYELIAEDDGIAAQNIITTKRRTASPKQVVEKVAKYYDLSSKDLYGTKRTKNIKNARQIAMYLMNEELGLSTVRIGTEFSKDHTTIMHGVKVIKTALKNDFRLREQITELREKIYSNWCGKAVKKSVDKSVKNRWIKNVYKFQLWKVSSKLTISKVQKPSFTRVLQKLFTWILHEKIAHFISVNMGVFHVFHVELL